MNQMIRCAILGSNINVTNMQETVSYLTDNLEQLRGQYVCVSNVHTTVMAYKDANYQLIQNEAAMALPDGKPLSLVSKLRGYKRAKRVPGPDLMTEIFKLSEEKNYRHYFYGSSQNTIDSLKNELLIKYPKLNIVGMYAPPFRQMTQEEDAEAIRRINETKPDYVWIGLGAPKQELWMAAHKDKIDGIMLGVGAGFDFHAGTARRAPLWMQEAYMEWLYRLLTNPKRLFKRYFQTNTEFIWLLVREEVRRRLHVKNWCHSVGALAELKKKPRMLVYAHYYYPDVASTGQILTELAESLADDINITVICAIPSYTGQTSHAYSSKRYYFEERNGVNILRVRVPNYSKTNVFSRVWNISTYFRRAIVATFKTGKIDYVFTISQPPILGGVLGVYGKIVKKAKLIYNIQDFNPEQVNAVEYTRNRIIISLMMGIDKITCRSANKVILVGRDMVQTLLNRFPKRPPSYCVINNWIDEKQIYPLPIDDENVVEFKKKYGLENKFIFMYSGNIGLYYDLAKIMTVLKGYRDRTDVVFAFAGGGALLERLIDYKNRHHMTNVLFIPYQEKENLNYSLNAADIHWVVNAKGIKGISVPSKLYGIMAAGKPVIGLLEEETEGRMIIEAAGCGFVSEPGNVEDIKTQIEEVLSNKDRLDVMGQAGRQYLEQHLAKHVSIERYLQEITTT